MKKMIKKVKSILFLFFLSATTFAQTHSIYQGGSGDGWGSVSYIQASPNIFTGGSADGWGSVNYIQPSSNIFTGGAGDGWSSDDDSTDLLLITLQSTEKQNESIADASSKIVSAIKCYPNPTNGILKIELPEALQKEDMVINIISAEGMVIEQIKQQAGSGSLFTLNLKRFAKGIYLIQAKTQTASGTQKIILQ